MTISCLWATGSNSCREPRCKIKCSSNNMLMPLNNFKGSYNQGSFPLLTDENLNCKSVNVVYLITCKVCSMQYVGETSREFGVRMREHWDKIRHGDKSQLIYAHFQSDNLHRSRNIHFFFHKHTLILGSASACLAGT